MSSFEINTANEDLSSVSDALRSIIEASNNVFFNTLSTNLGMSNASKSYVEPYVPAILYALYDGYYIYAPTKVPEILTNSKGVALAVGDHQYDSSNLDQEAYKVDKAINGYYKLLKDSSNFGSAMKYDSTYTGVEYGQILYTAKDDNGKELIDGEGNILYTPDPNKALLKTKNVLKTYMPYSARYKENVKDEKYDITVTYTLDNFITIEGCLYPENNKTIYVTKSGYLINIKDKDNNPTITIALGEGSIDKYSENRVQKYIEEGGQVSVIIDNQEIINISNLTKSAASYHLNS